MGNTVTAVYSEGQFNLAGSGILTRLRRYFLGILLTGRSLLFLAVDSAAQVITSGPPTCSGVALTFDLCPVRPQASHDQRAVEW